MSQEDKDRMEYLRGLENITPEELDELQDLVDAQYETGENDPAPEVVGGDS